MLYFLVTVLLVVLGILALAYSVSLARVSLDRNRKRAVESERALGKAERSLRSIANGAGNPVLEAQIALDEITAHHEKELN